MKICGWYRKCLFPYSENARIQRMKERMRKKWRFRGHSLTWISTSLVASALVWLCFALLGFEPSPHRFNPMCLSSLLCSLCAFFFSRYNCDHVFFCRFLPYERKSVIYEFVCVNVTLSFVAKDIRRMQKGCHRFASRPLLKACKRVCVS